MSVLQMWRVDRRRIVLFGLRLCGMQDVSVRYKATWMDATTGAAEMTDTTLGTLVEMRADTMKTCRKCGVVQSVENFTRNKTMADGRLWQCKTCCSQIKRSCSSRIPP